jgi:hypothetical protein
MPARYQAHVRACITGQYVPELDPEHVDHRYFYEDKDGIGHYTCGIVRNTVTRALAEEGAVLFSINDSIRAISRFISNTSVVGFFLEQAILQTIVTQGIPCLDLAGPVPQIIFEGGGQPEFDLRHSKALYVPMKFNFPAIDALILRVDDSKKTAELMPIQITIAKSRSDSEDLFLKDWSRWVRDLYLYDYDVTLTFVWITAAEGYSKTGIEAKYSGKRGTGEQLVSPGYSSVEIPFKEVDAGMEDIGLMSERKMRQPLN